MIKVKNEDELRKIIEAGNIPLDTIDISNITDMRNIISNDNNLSLLLVKSFSLCGLFKGITEINGSIANWDVSRVWDMEYIFADSKISPDISN